MLSLLPLALTVTGAFFFFRLLGVLTPGRLLRAAKRALFHREGLFSLSLALAGTLGVGNLVGVAVGLSVGGAGSVFWLLVAALVAAPVKYAETALAVGVKSGEGQGMMRVLSGSFRRTGCLLSRIYAGICVFLALSMGAALQSESAASAAGFLGLSPRIFAPTFTLLLLALLLIGEKRLSRVTAVLIPLAALLYILLSFAVILPRAEKLPVVLRLILSSAFSAEAPVGGALGFLFSRALREGFFRGILSNEAGAGTSSLAHSQGGADPVTEGLYAAFEVFFDAFLCLLTAFVLLLSPASGAAGAGAVFASFSSALGARSVLPLSCAVILFAASAAVCWFDYGRSSLAFLFPRARKLFSPAFLSSLFLGCFLPVGGIVFAVDLALFFATALTLSALYKNAGRVSALSAKDSFEIAED